MRTTILILAWITPALIAGMLGWNGIWGTGSALVEYLIPMPVAGGVFHVPSFVIAVALIGSMPRLPLARTRLIGVTAFAIGAAALALQVDFDRLNAWLFTDYDPVGSPLRLDGNPFLLFVTTDAFWTGFAAFVTAGLAAPRLWLAVPAAILAVAGFRIGGYQLGGPAFATGTSFPGPSRGQMIALVYTSAAYDEAVLRAWLDERDDFARPWLRSNAEHTALIFTNSRQAVEWGRIDQLAGPATIGTACLYEEDMTIELSPGYVDCFAGRATVLERLEALTDSQSTGLGNDIDIWYATVLLCDGVEVPAEYTDIAMHDLCRRLRSGLDATVERVRQRYGNDSRQVAFILAEADRAGLASAR